jgi:hypothetical protein
MSDAVHRVLGLSAVALIMAAFVHRGVSAQEMRTAEAKPAACNSLKDESACGGREDCSWVAASVDPKTNKEKRRAYCRSKPKSKAKAKT